MVELPASPLNRSVPAAVRMNQPRDGAAPVLLSDSAAKDVMITWFRGEFAAANAIIDALCGHLMQVFSETGSEYEAVMAALHRRRLNWIPVLQMQNYHSIAQVTAELQLATTKRLKKGNDEKKACSDDEKVKYNCVEATMDDESPSSDITDSGSREEERVEEITICSNHEEECETRASIIRMTKRFAAKEHVRGHTANVVKGLKQYQDVFTGTQLSKLLISVNELREAGRNQELSGETFVLFNKNTKGTKRELIQLGVPIFGHTTHEHSVEPLPVLLQSVIDHLLEWRLIPEYKRPNGCVINFFDEDEHSQPFQKPPHVDQPISILFLSESIMVFGHRLGLDNDGNFRGSLTLPLKEGSLLVMRGNSADMARHVMCPTPNKRIAITFFKLKPDSDKLRPPPATNPDLGVVTLWRPDTPAPPSHTVLNQYAPVRTPMVILAPVPPVTLSPKRLDAGTGVFLPWTPSATRKPAKHLPPRVQRLRLLSSAKSVRDSESSSPEIGVS